MLAVLAGEVGYPETADWAGALLREYSSKYGNCVLVPNGTHESKLKFLSSSRAKLAVEIAFTTEPVKGSETFFRPASRKGKDVATKVQRAMSTLLPPNRGVNAEGLERLVLEAPCPTLVIKPGSVHNFSACSASMAICCSLLADVLYEALHGNVSS